MLNSKQRAKLRSYSNTMAPVFQVGKGGITNEVCKAADMALEARELIKISVLETAGITSRQAADKISEATSSEVVSVIGRRFVIYRMSENIENRKISKDIL